MGFQFDEVLQRLEPSAMSALFSNGWKWKETPLYNVGFYSSERGLITSGCRLFRRMLKRRDDDFALELIGIGGVFTRKEFRGCGYAGAMIMRILDALYEKTVGVILHSKVGKEHNLYLDLGFLPLWRNPLPKEKPLLFFPASSLVYIGSLDREAWVVDPAEHF